MVAALKDEEPTGHGHELLKEWGLYSRGGGFGGSTEWAVKERLQPAHETMPDRIMLVDRIVGGIWREFPHYEKMTKAYYFEDYQPSYWEIAGRLKYTSQFVKLSIQAICDLVARRHEVLTT